MYDVKIKSVPGTLCWMIFVCITHSGGIKQCQCTVFFQGLALPNCSVWVGQYNDHWKNDVDVDVDVDVGNFQIERI